MGLGFQCHCEWMDFSKGGVKKRLLILKLLRNFDCEIAHIIKGRIRIKVYLADNIGG